MICTRSFRSLSAKRIRYACSKVDRNGALPTRGLIRMTSRPPAICSKSETARSTSISSEEVGATMMNAPSQALEIRRDGGVRVLAER